MELNNTLESREAPGLVKVAKNHEKESARFVRFGLPALLFAALFAFGSYRNPQGIAFSIPVAGAFILWARISGAKRLRGFPAFLCTVCILLSVHVWTSASAPLHAFDKLGIAVLLLLFLIETDSRGTVPVRGEGAASEPDPGAYIAGILRTAVLPFARFFIPFTDFAAYAGTRMRGNNEHAGRQGRAVLKGFLLSLPLLFAVILLLDDADAVFDHMLVRMFSGFTVPELAGKALTILCIAAAGFILFYTLSSFFHADPETEAAERPEQAGAPLIRYRAGCGEPLTAITIVFLLTAVYVCFCAIQLVYLAGRHTLPEGLTYAQYAHEGFYQLAAVCTINLIIVNVCSSRFRKHRVLSALLLIMSCCTFIMVASSAARMFLYIRQYQLTFLRLFVLWFLAVLTVWLLTVCVSILRAGTPVFKIWVVTAAVMYLLFAFAHPDYWIARYDLAAPGIRDEWYTVTRLSDDAVPAYAGNEELLQERLTVLQDREDMYRSENDKKVLLFDRIRTYNLSEAAARRYLGIR